MLELKIIFTALGLVFLITPQHGSPLQNKGVKSILELLQQPKYHHLQKHSALDSSANKESDNNSLYGVLKNMEVIDLIHKANRETDKHKDSYHDDLTHERDDPDSHGHYEANSLSETQRILDQLLQNKNSAYSKKVKHQQLNPSNLLGSVSLDDGNRKEQSDEFNEYSKIYVVLDPLAVQNSKNKNALTHLISRILSLSSSSNEKKQQKINKKQHYKGFKVIDDFISRRYRRDSKENNFEAKKRASVRVIARATNEADAKGTCEKADDSKNCEKKESQSLSEDEYESKFDVKKERQSQSKDEEKSKNDLKEESQSQGKDEHEAESSELGLHQAKIETVFESDGIVETEGAGKTYEYEMDYVG